MKRTGLLAGLLLGLGLPVATLVTSYTLLPGEAWLHEPAGSTGRPIRVVAAGSVPRPNGARVVFPSWLIAPRGTSSSTEFMKIRNLSGEQFCGILRDASIPVSAWRASASGRGQFECYSATITYSANESGEPGASMFILVRGEASGTIDYVRIKLVAPQTEDGQAAIDGFSTLVTLISDETHWFDPRSLREAARERVDISEENFGLKVTFTSERMSSDSFNLVISMAPADEGGTKFLRVPSP